MTKIIGEDYLSGYRGRRNFAVSGAILAETGKKLGR